MKKIIIAIMVLTSFIHTMPSAGEIQSVVVEESYVIERQFPEVIFMENTEVVCDEFEVVEVSKEVAEKVCEVEIVEVEEADTFSYEEQLVELEAILQEINAKRLEETNEQETFETTISLENNEEESEEAIEIILEESVEITSNVDVSEDVSNVIECFDAEKALYVSEEGISYSITGEMKILATAYCVCPKCCGKMPDDPKYGITASGLDLKPYLEEGVNPHIVAVDVGIIPLGTEMYIEVPELSRDSYISADYGFATAKDTGGMINGYRIDIFFMTHQEAVEWGVRDVIVHLLSPIS